MVGQLGDLKEIARDPAHEMTGAVLIIEGKGEGLHMGEEVPADVGLDAHAHQVSPVGDDKAQPGLEHIGQDEDGHDGEKGGKQAVRQQGLHGPAGRLGKGQIHRGNAQGTDHIQQEEGHMGPVIGREQAEIPPFPECFG